MNKILFRLLIEQDYFAAKIIKYTLYVICFLSNSLILIFQLYAQNYIYFSNDSIFQ